jgi:hypothetical protein
MSKLETNTIDTVSGTSTLQVGSTNTTTITLGVSGDTINVPSGVTIANSGTATGFGGANTPAFLAYANSDQGSISANTDTKLTNFGVEVFDTDNTFSSSRFTPGVVGKYFVYGTVYGTGTNGSRNFLYVYVNGSNYQTSAQLPGADLNFPQQVSAIVDVTSTSDYIELYFNSTGTTGTAYSSGVQVKFGGFKLIT